MVSADSRKLLEKANLEQVCCIHYILYRHLWVFIINTN